MLGPQESGLLVVGGLLLMAVGCCLSSNHEQRDGKKLDLLMAKIKLAPRNLSPLINRNLSNDNVTLFLTPNYSETSFLSSLLTPLI